MRTRSETSRRKGPNDVGTLWTIERSGIKARCALMAWPKGWELRVVVDSVILLTERRDRADDTFALAARWKERMLAKGWQQIVPCLADRTLLEDQQPA